MTIRISGRDSIAKISNIRSAADEAINGAFEGGAVLLERNAKQNAPWTDRTGNARRTLEGVCRLMPLGIKKVSIVGKMRYSPKLELGYGGRYSILYPTVLENAVEILDSVVDALGGVRI